MSPRGLIDPDMPIRAVRGLRDGAMVAVSSARDGAMGAVSSARDGAYGAVSTARDGAYGAVYSARDGAYGAVSTARDGAYGAVSTARDGAYGAVSTARDGAYGALGAVSSARDGALGAVSTAGGCAVGAVSSARDGAYGALSSAQGLLDGKWNPMQQRRADGTAMGGTISEKLPNSATGTADLSSWVGGRQPAAYASGENGTRAPRLESKDGKAAGSSSSKEPSQCCASGDCILLATQGLRALLTWPFASRRPSPRRQEP